MRKQAPQPRLVPVLMSPLRDPVMRRLRLLLNMPILREARETQGTNLRLRRGQTMRGRASRTGYTAQPHRLAYLGRLGLARERKPQRSS